MRIALLGDLHFYQLLVWPWLLGSKRLLGQTNLWLNRRRHFRPKLWSPLSTYLRRLSPDVLLGAGDYTTTALQGEFDKARAALQPLLETTQRTILVPGNHDRYTYTSMRQRRFETAFADYTAQTWPYVASLADDLALVALDPTRPNLWGAGGCLGPAQLARLETILTQELEGFGPGPVLVLCHYPIGAPPGVSDESRSHRLGDREALRAILAASERPVIYLHGHVHVPWEWRPQDCPNVLVINAGAPLLTSHRYPRGQGFVLMNWKDNTLSVERHLPHAAEDQGWEIRPIAMR